MSLFSINLILWGAILNLLPVVLALRYFVTRPLSNLCWTQRTFSAGLKVRNCLTSSSVGLLASFTSKGIIIPLESFTISSTPAS